MSNLVAAKHRMPHSRTAEQQNSIIVSRETFQPVAWHKACCQQHVAPQISSWQHNTLKTAQRSGRLV
jgi:hypothetical protein